MKFSFLPLMVLALLLLLAACQKDIEVKPTINYVPIQAISFYDDTDFPSLYSMTYNEEGLLAEIDLDDLYFKYNYAEGQLIEEKLYLKKNDRLSSTTKYFYDTQGHLEAVKKFSGFDTLQATTQFRYELDAKGRPIKKIRFNLNGLFQIEEFVWRKGNIVESVLKNRGGEVVGSDYYAYDNKKNPYLNFPTFIKDVLSQCQNNVIVRSYNQGFQLNLQCDPCTISYEYNGDNYPEKIFNENSTTRLIY